MASRTFPAGLTGFQPDATMKHVHCGPAWVGVFLELPPGGQSDHRLAQRVLPTAKDSVSTPPARRSGRELELLELLARERSERSVGHVFLPGQIDCR